MNSVNNKEHKKFFLQDHKIQPKTYILRNALQQIISRAITCSRTGSVEVAQKEAVTSPLSEMASTLIISPCSHPKRRFN